jgi:hypothetical protein
MVGFGAEPLSSPVIFSRCPRLQARGEFLAGNAAYHWSGCYTRQHAPLIWLKKQFPLIGENLSSAG